MQVCFFLGPSGRRAGRTLVTKCVDSFNHPYLTVLSRSSYLITIVFMLITAAVLAEICSALPLSGSIYIWAAESAGPKYARFFGFIVAWWSCTAWMTFAAGNCQVSMGVHLMCIYILYHFQTTANYVVSQLAVWGIDFPGGITNDNVKWRALIWAVSEGFLVLSIAINYLPPRMYSAVFRFSIFIMMLDFFLCLIWLPIGVSKTYGFRSASDVFTMTCELISIKMCFAFPYSSCRQWNWSTGGMELDVVFVRILYQNIRR